MKPLFQVSLVFFMEAKKKINNMENQVFTPDEDDNKILDDYIKNWQQWPKPEALTPEQRLDELEDFAFCHEELIFELYAKIDSLKEEMNQIKNGK